MINDMKYTFDTYTNRTYRKIYFIKLKYNKFVFKTKIDFKSLRFGVFDTNL